jgi:hypothetical protein
MLSNQNESPKKQSRKSNATGRTAPVIPEYFEQIKFHTKHHAGMLSELQNHIGNICFYVGEERYEGAYDVEENHELYGELTRWLELQAPAIFSLCKVEAKAAELRRDLWMGLDLKVVQVLQSSASAHSRGYMQRRIARYADTEARALAPIEAGAEASRA